MNRRALLSLPLASLAASQTVAPHRHSKECMYEFERQELVVPDFDADGYVLDIGGGGEGIIGLLKPRQVIAIDLSQRELADAPPGPLKIVMDARELKFLDGSFATATSFFTLMYVSEADQPKVFCEVFRVLKPGGRFLVWDVTLPVQIDPARDVALYRFLFKLPDREVKTGYGVLFPPRLHDVGYFLGLAQSAGFRVAAGREHGRTLFLELRKPTAAA